jgi:hypothetical protein
LSKYHATETRQSDRHAIKGKPIPEVESFPFIPRVSGVMKKGVTI